LLQGICSISGATLKPYAKNTFFHNDINFGSGSFSNMLTKKLSISIKPKKKLRQVVEKKQRKI